jgi:RHS repeat-associated protein
LEWDDLLRPSRLLDRNEHIIHQYQYGYKGNGDNGNFFKLTTNYTKVAHSDLQQIQIVSYRDGLNRLIQQVKTAHSPNNLDVITAQTYDNQGRVIKQYEPVESSLNTGAFQNIPITTPHTLIEYEAAPLHRQSGMTLPNWHKTSTEYGANTTAIRDHFNQRFFLPNTLNVQTVTDPEGNRKSSFLDKKGRIVLVRRDSINSTKKNSIYTVFDPKDRKTIILPEGTETYPLSPFPNLIYTYLYNHLDQVIEHKIPDKEKIETIYHPHRDYPVAWRGGNLRADGKWMVMAYDNYGRNTQTGLITNTGVPNASNLSPTEIWTKTFWDGAASTGIADKTNENIYTGKVHFTETAILNGNATSTNRLLKVNVYDDYGRLDSLFCDTHLGGKDILHLEYDFIDNQTVQHKKHQYLPNNAVENIIHTQQYDHQGRLKNVLHQVNAHPQQQLVNLHYDHENQIIQKNLGGLGNNSFLQQVDYSYLENGFLSGINKTSANALLSPTARLNNAPADLFTLDIRYDTTLNVVARKNGSIAELIWQTQGDRHHYTFNYDYLDRLTRATYGANNNAYGTEYSYDARGNFVNIKRRGVYSDGNNFQAQQIDNMIFTPQTGSNKIKTISDTAPCPDNKTIHKALDNTEIHAVGNIIIADNIVNDKANITYQAGTNITLKAGFHAKAGADFIAKIADCPQTGYETEGFVQRSNNEYLYDGEGNQTRDPNKGIITEYNYLNLPYKVTFNNGNIIEWSYLANGIKTQKTVKRNGLTTPILKQDYFENIEYLTDTLDAIYLGDAKVVFANGNFREYQYYLSDHLNSNRVLFSDTDNDGIPEIIQENHFYPFGLHLKGDFVQNTSQGNKYLYNGKELDTDFGLNWYHYGARMYDPVIGSFTGVDPISDKFPHLSTFNYASNDPISNIDLYGLQGLKAITTAGRIILRASTTVGRFGVKRGISEAIKGEGASIKADAQTLIAPDASIGDRAAALYDLVIGIGDLNETDENVVTDAPVVKLEEGDDRVDEDKKVNSPERGKRAKESDDANEQLEGTEQYGKDSSKSRPSIREEGDWEGVKKRPKQNKIHSNKKSKQRAKHKNKRRNIDDELDN